MLTAIALTAGATLVSVPFDAGRGLMPTAIALTAGATLVSVPFDAGRGLMPSVSSVSPVALITVSVPFDAGRGLMLTGTEGDSRLVAMFQYPSMRVVD